MKILSLSLTCLYVLIFTSCGFKKDPSLQNFFEQCFDGKSSDSSNNDQPSKPLKQHTDSVTIDYSGNPAKGSARIFDRNIKGSLTDNVLHLLGNKTLTSTRFATFTGDEERASESNHVFNYDPSDARFREVSLFTNATKMLAWFEQLGFDPMNEQISIGVNAVINGSVNNALYIPAYNDSNPTIRIGNGDGIMLDNLSTDSDVIAHFVSHHIIFRNLKSTIGESSILHEGLADFFVIIRNDDPCVGRTICPAGSSAYCAVDAQCLRTANNKLNFIDTEGQSPHLRGQVVSGMLWDLRKDGKIDKQDLIRLVFDSVQKLKTNSGISDFIAALLLVDEENFNGQHKDAIKNAAKSRGLLL